ncbi:MAG: ArdC-like ssDNA-binding domain-containing protein [Roseburia sp.]|nr:ArdC-like ssDNA-binding domain-containing protein [Roseburia sp.]MCM1420479.1 ArdC-like ssDNA-binding domain-containing protein [Bacteroides sp.]
MKEKTPQEQAAGARQTELIINALNGASGEGHWLNVTGKERPRIYPQNMTLSPFNSLILGLHSDNGGYSTSMYTTFNDAKKHGDAVLKDERSVPINWYRWESYVNRHDDTDKISREEYLQLPPDRQKLFKGVRQREIRPLFNLEQTTFQFTDADTLEKLRQRFGGIAARGNLMAEERQLRSSVSQLRKQISENLIPIRKSATGEARYDSGKDAVYMPEQKHYGNYHDYMQDMLRQVIAATGHRERQSREGMVMRGGTGRSESLRYELLVGELASGVKMMELGQPAKLSPESMRHVPYWTQELRENPCLIDAIESDVNNALDIIKKAEHGERMELKGDVNRQQTVEYRDKSRPQVSSSEALVLLDIMAHGGMEISGRNFRNTDEHKAFMEKFGLDYYNRLTTESLEQARHGQTDSELIDIAYTQASNEAAKIFSRSEELLPREWELKGSYTIADRLSKVPDKRSRMFLVVQDMNTGIADVVLPGAARRGGDVVLPNGDRRNFWLSPDEVLLPEERKEAGARVVTHNLPGMNKDKIESALLASGAAYVRFFSSEGRLAYRPDDAYFAGKQVISARLDGKELLEQSKYDVAEAASLASEVRFDRIQMVRDDDGKWALLLKPESEPSFSIYPDKEDINRFFSTVRQNDQIAANAVRNELAQKYHALAKANPELRKDLFGQMPEGIDPRQIERVNIFKAKDGTYLCLPKITGVEKLQPRVVSQQQWQRLWATDDIAKYKTTLAATLFADILQNRKQEETTVRHNAEEVVQSRPDVAVTSPEMRQYEDMKAKHPDVILIFRAKGGYEIYQEDADKAARLLNLPNERREYKNVNVVAFATGDLDIHLPRLIHAGQRVAICDALETPKENVKQGQSNEPVLADNSRQAGLRM